MKTPTRNQPLKNCHQLRNQKAEQMKKEIIKHLTKDFESCVNRTKNGIEFWFARDLQHLLGYTEWRNFLQVIHKAKTSCETAGHLIPDHFVDVNKTIAMPKGASKAKRRNSPPNRTNWIRIKTV